LSKATGIVHVYVVAQVLEETRREKVVRHNVKLVYRDALTDLQAALLKRLIHLHALQPFELDSFEPHRRLRGLLRARLLRVESYRKERGGGEHAREGVRRTRALREGQGHNTSPLAYEFFGGVRVF
jgi:hypothetical protein